MTELRPHSIQTALFGTVLFTIILVALLGVGCGPPNAEPGTGRPEMAEPIDRPLCLSWNSVRSETVYDRETNAPKRVRFETNITHFGRVVSVATAQGAGDRFVYVYNDSIRLRTRIPYRLDAFMSADTLFTSSGSTGTTVSSETMGSADSMLVCLFNGPALRIGTRDGNIGHLKAACPAGVYQRLDLPITYGLFVVAGCGELRSTGDRCVLDRAYPDYSGLGFSPIVRLSYRVTGTEDGVVIVSASCDTTFSNARTVTPAGETVDIISDRIRISGSLRIRPANTVHEGTFELSETVKYVRPTLDTSVLSKSCVYGIDLEDF